MGDQINYTRAQVEALLPLVYDDDSLVLASRAESEVRSRSDPALGGDLLAAVIDVRRAWHEALEREDHDFLVARHVHGITFEAIAELAGLESAEEAADIEGCAVQALLDYLNGGRR
jgi:hypothetical protein